MRQASVEFERRSVLYARLDRELGARTRFFAAAASINAVLAKRFELAAVIRSPHGLAFIREVGTTLETANLRYAGRIQRTPSLETLDQALVYAEQSRVQECVRAHQANRPQLWASVRSDLNALLNNYHYASLLSPWLKDCGQLVRVLREVRRRLGTTVDFALESHRILIGLTLIEHIRRDSAARRIGTGTPATPRMGIGITAAKLL